MNRTLERLWARIQRAFELARRIKDVDSWDGSASRWDSTEAYCEDCLIDVNAAAGREEKAQSHCMLPIREPGDSADTYVRQAVHAAAGGRGIGRVKRPDDVPEEAWDAAVKAAANKLITAYNAMDEVAPDAVYALADKEPPERAIAWSGVYEQVALAVEADPILGPMWPWINDLYQDAEQTVAIVSAGGKLYRLPVMINGTAVETGVAQEVEVSFAPARKRAFTIVRQADGRHRWFAITETAVLLRVGEIDSKALFDSFIAHAEETGEYPALRFYHDPRIEFGRADWLAREDNCYLASGMLDEEHPVARAFTDASEAGRGVWGTSNGFEPTAEPERMVITEGVTIPVYTAGIHREISVLPESDAASWFTAITARGVTRMRDKLKEALETLFGDAQAAAAFIAQVDDTNREITERGLITRDAETAAGKAGMTTEETSEDDNPASGAKTTEEGEEREIVLDEETMAAIARQVPAPMVDLAPLEAHIAALSAELSACQERLTALERDEEAKRAEWRQDLPARARVSVTHRPREARRTEKAHGKPDYAAIAASTVESLPS